MPETVESPEAAETAEVPMVIEPLSKPLRRLLKMIMELGVADPASHNDDELMRFVLPIDGGVSVGEIRSLISWLHVSGTYIALWLGCNLGAFYHAASNPADAGECDPEAMPGLSPDSGAGGVENEQRNDETPWG